MTPDPRDKKPADPLGVLLIFGQWLLLAAMIFTLGVPVRRNLPKPRVVNGTGDGRRVAGQATSGLHEKVAQAIGSALTDGADAHASKGSPGRPGASDDPNALDGTPAGVDAATGAVEDNAGGDDAAAAGGVAAPGKRPPVRIEILHDWPPAPPLDINRADLAELKALPAVDDRLALAILHYRQELAHETRRLPFNNLDDLLNVPGFDGQLLQDLRPFLDAGGRGAGASVGEVGFEQPLLDEGEIRPSTSVVQRRWVPLEVHSRSQPARRSRWVLRSPRSEAVLIEFERLSTPIDQPLRLYDLGGNLMAVYGGELGSFYTRPIEGAAVVLERSGSNEDIDFVIKGLWGIGGS